MSELWSFLTQPENRETLSWLGGGLVVVCGGLWTLLKFYLGRKPAGGSAQSASSGPAASDDRGGIAVGRDLRIDNRRGLPPGHLLLLVLAFLGALLLAIALAGNKVTVNNGVGIGGDVEGSTINSQ